MKPVTRRRAMIDFIKAHGIDLHKDFYELTFSEVIILNKIRRYFHYSGANGNGRSRASQFYYFVQSFADKV